MFSNKKNLLKSLLTVIVGCGSRRGNRYDIKDSLQTRPREQPEPASDEISASVSRTRRGVPMENSVAVEKHSDDPYADFKDSMLLMILEKDIHSKEDLQELLSCFLRLNSPGHHEDIIRAFMEILIDINWTARPNN